MPFAVVTALKPAQEIFNAVRAIGKKIELFENRASHVADDAAERRPSTAHFIAAPNDFAANVLPNAAKKARILLLYCA
jgi:hypothetical protein